MVEIKNLIKRFSTDSIGEIIKTQTTYMDIVCRFQSKDSSVEEKFRINYLGKREFLLSQDKFTQLQLFNEHPLLLDYKEPIVSVHLASVVVRKEKFREELKSTAYQTFGKWRSFEDYLNMPLNNLLEKSYGILMSAPKTFAETVVQMAEKDNIKLIIHDYHKTTDNPFALLFDENYVIADDFKVEILDY